MQCVASTRRCVASRSGLQRASTAEPNRPRRRRRTRLRCVSASDLPPTVSATKQSDRNDLELKDRASKKLLTYQEAISKLQEYWSSVGCVVWLPHNTEACSSSFCVTIKIQFLGWSRDDESSDVSEGSGTGAVERLLRGAEHPTG